MTDTILAFSANFGTETIAPNSFMIYNKCNVYKGGGRDEKMDRGGNYRGDRDRRRRCGGDMVVADRNHARPRHNRFRHLDCHRNNDYYHHHNNHYYNNDYHHDDCDDHSDHNHGNRIVVGDNDHNDRADRDDRAHRTAEVDCADL